ncbi:MAG: hypothetical protein WCJ81_02095 [bacterium]
MQQPALFDQSFCAQHTILGNNIQAVFHEKEEGTYDVVLSISSQKFLLHIKPGNHEIEEFEVQAVRGFIDYNVAMMYTLKKIMKYICYGEQTA